MVLKSISKLSGIDYNITGGEYRCVLTGGQSICIEGIKSVSSFDAANVELNLKKGKLIIAGENLELTKLSKGYIDISGKILSITVV